MKPLLLIYTDRDMLRLALQRMTAPDYTCESLGRGEAGFEIAPDSRAPDVVILDHPGDVLECMRDVLGNAPGVPIVVWQRSDASEPSLNALDWGARGVLHDVSTSADVLECLRAVMSGHAWAPPSVTRAVLNSRRCRLTPREGQLLKLVSQGLRNKEIAFQLNISEGTVKVYFSRLFDKLDVSDRYELALLGLRHSAQTGKSSTSLTVTDSRERSSDTLNAVFVQRPSRNFPSPRGAYPLGTSHASAVASTH